MPAPAGDLQGRGEPFLLKDTLTNLTGREKLRLKIVFLFVLDTRGKGFAACLDFFWGGLSVRRKEKRGENGGAREMFVDFVFKWRIGGAVERAWAWPLRR